MRTERLLYNRDGFRLSEVKDDDGTVYNYADETEGYFMVVNVSSEGIIFDVYDVDEDGNDMLRGTDSGTWDEMMDRLIAEASPDPRYEGSED